MPSLEYNAISPVSFSPLNDEERPYGFLAPTWQAKHFSFCSFTFSIIEIAFVVCTANYLCGYTNSIIELDNAVDV